MVTAGALRALEDADLVLIPHSRDGRPSVAEGAVRAHLRDGVAVPMVFPMIRDAQGRDAALRGRCFKRETSHRWGVVKLKRASIVVPSPREMTT